MTMGGMYHCEHGEYSTHEGFQCDECDKEKPAPPEVPAPDEVWLTFSPEVGWCEVEPGTRGSVRYVRAREGGR